MEASQRAAIIVALREWRGAGRYDSKGVTVTPLKPVATNDELAEAAGVSKSTIRRAKRAQKAGNGEAVAKGEVPAHKAGNDSHARC